MLENKSVFSLSNLILPECNRNPVTISLIHFVDIEGGKKKHKAPQNLNTTDFFPSAIKEYNESYRFTIEVLQEQGVRLRYLKNKSVCGPSEICMNIREIFVK